VNILRTIIVGMPKHAVGEIKINNIYVFSESHNSTILKSPSRGKEKFELSRLELMRLDCICFCYI